MALDELLKTYRVPFNTANESGNVTEGWIGVQCPFCDDHSDHLGCNLSTGGWHCWRCGSKSASRVIAELIGIPLPEAGRLIEQYQGRRRKRRESSVKAAQEPICYPPGTGPLTMPHVRYLERRSFDAKYLEAKWHIRATGPVASLDGRDYKNRVIAPIYCDGDVVSWQSRSISENAHAKYLPCPKEREVYRHQDLIYECPEDVKRDVGILVEGVTDAWRLGPAAFATFGTSVTSRQVLAISKRFREVHIAFDPEPEARKKAEELARRLSAMMVHAHVLDLDQEPGDMADEDARHLINGLFNGAA